MKKSNKNPLFVVTNKGQDVVQAKSFLDAFIKKIGFEPVLIFLDNILEFILTNIKGHAGLLIAKKIIDDFVFKLEHFIKKIDPILAFSIFKN